MEISGKELLHFNQETSSLISNQTNHRTNMFSPYLSNSCFESDYECICIVINGKTSSVPLNILSSVYVLGALITAILDANFNISKHSMMPEWHHLKISSTMHEQQESTKKKL